MLGAVDGGRKLACQDILLLRALLGGLLDLLNIPIGVLRLDQDRFAHSRKACRRAWLTCITIDLATMSWAVVYPMESLLWSTFLRTDGLVMLAHRNIPQDAVHLHDPRGHRPQNAWPHGFIGLGAWCCPSLSAQFWQQMRLSWQRRAAHVPVQTPSKTAFGNFHTH